MRPSRILKPETLVKEVIRTFKEGFVNPFSVNTDSKRLFVLSSGVPVADDVAMSMLSINNEVERLTKTFQSERSTAKQHIHAPIKRLKVINFESFFILEN